MGGLNEYVMGVMADQNGVPMSGRNNAYHSGFNGNYDEGNQLTTGIDFPDPKYYDLYTYGGNVGYFRRILGDATGEMGPFGSYSMRLVGSWYEDEGWFVNTESWFIRGGQVGAGNAAGIFQFCRVHSGPTPHDGYRIVLTP